jgi:predicted lipoprotein with Yx(FWY)xxD motif
MRTTRTYAAAASALIATALVLLATACGGGSSASAAQTPTAPNPAKTVSVVKVDGVGSVLVDSEAMALYSPAQEANGTIACTGSCTSIWVPLTLPMGQSAPTGTAGLGSKLGTVQRPDGSTQVTFDGKPLYTFAEDSGPGVVSGDDFSDSFDGTSFTWHVASIGAASGNSSSSSSSNGPYGY